MEKYLFIDAKKEDFKEILEIYNYFIKNSTSTFHISKVDLDYLEEHIYIEHHKYKTYLIKTNNNKICGYCLYTQHSPREAYNRTADIAIYIKPEFQKKGIGKLAINKLENEASIHNIKTLLAYVSGENIASINLFKKLNYKKVGKLEKVGEKFNRVLDVEIYQKIL